MARGFPCPNPRCRHMFPAAELVGVAALACPRCRGVFQVAQHFAAPPAPAVSPPERSQPRPRGRPPTVLVLVGAVLMAAGLVTGALVRGLHHTPPAPQPAELYRSAE